MTEPAQPSPAALRDAAARLNDATGKLNEQLRAVETGLKDLGLGVSASTLMRLDTGQRLAFARYTVAGDSHWRLLVGCEGEAQKPLLQASRADRLLASYCLPALLKALYRASEAELEQVMTASTDTESFLASLQARAEVSGGE